MLLAPFSLTETSVRRRDQHRDETRVVPPWLRAWAIGGIALVLLIPALRGDNTSGLSLPFWLVAAPLINIAWMSRARGFALVRDRIAHRAVRRGMRSCRTR